MRPSQSCPTLRHVHVRPARGAGSRPQAAGLPYPPTFAFQVSEEERQVQVEQLFKDVAVC